MSSADQVGGHRLAHVSQANECDFQVDAPVKEDATKLRLGVIGVGLLGERHTRFWAQQPDVELA